MKMKNYVKKVDEFMAENPAGATDECHGIFELMGFYLGRLTLWCLFFWLIIPWKIIGLFRKKEKIKDPSLYNDNIYTRKELKDKKAKKIIDYIFEKECTKLDSDEEIYYVVRDKNFSDGNGLIFTNKRMIYGLAAPKNVLKTIVKSGFISGSIPLEKLERPIVESSLTGEAKLIFGVNFLGRLHFIATKKLDTFLKKIFITINE